MNWKDFRNMVLGTCDDKTKRIETNNVKLVKDIEGFGYRGGEKARNDMIAKVVAYGYGLLDGTYDIGDNLHVNGLAGIDGNDGAFDNADDTILVKDGIFSDPAAYGLDILTLMHEVEHYAEKCGRLDNGCKVIAARSDIGCDHQTFLTAMENTVLASRGLEVNKIDSSIRARDYLRSKYYLQTGEINARNFSLYAINNLIADMESRSSLDGNEYCNLINLRLAQKKYGTMYKQGEADAKAFLLRYGNYYKELFDSYRGDLMKPQKDGKCILDKITEGGLSYIDRVSKVLGDEWIQYTTRGLQYEYDDEFAHRWVDCLLASEDLAIKTFAVKSIYLLNLTTPFNATSKETEEAVDSLREINHIRVAAGNDILITSIQLTAKDENVITD